MRQINPLFLTGTLGMLFTSMFHILMAAMTSEETAAAAFWMLYPVFAVVLIAGTLVMMKRKQAVKE
ncbi:hypothetical protein [Salinimicrobium sp. HB62]|uniref:hypothetical protein n=1 Tax=Salinimicrobium sp. HB62 TaxID=3077781 RepID=UPI002D7898A6|nr:hypothetical protein [Salinimicrobium sp. HB62]